MQLRRLVKVCASADVCWCRCVSVVDVLSCVQMYGSISVVYTSLLYWLFVNVSVTAFVVCHCTTQNRMCTSYHI